MAAGGQNGGIFPRPEVTHLTVSAFLIFCVFFFYLRRFYLREGQMS
jgi:hypothetical protein